MAELTPSSIRLRDATLARLPVGVRGPRYDRAALTPGIVHIGLGNFHRAHQAWYLHRLMDEGAAHDWAILGAGVRPADAAMRERLMGQDGLTTLIELDPAGTSAEVTGPMTGFVPVAADNGPLVAALSDPAIRIVGLTVTEGGYYRDADGGFDADHPDIRHDAARPDRPRTAFGAIVAALRARRAAGHGPLTGMSCDNLQGNGAALRAAVAGLARAQDARDGGGLADWIVGEARFPDAMVDCIVPATGPAEVALARGFGIDDAAPVTHEPFRQWVIEDAFAAGRPAWEAVGATLVADVRAHEAMKLRVLNAGHQLLANAGEVMGVETIADCMAHSAIGGFFARVLGTEVAPHVEAVPGMPVGDYVALVSRRFANPMIRDTVRRVAFDGSSRHPGFLLPTLRDRLAAGGAVEGLALAEALWCRMCAGVREDGGVIKANDPAWAALRAAAEAARHRPAAWLEQAGIYGALAREPRLAEPFGRWLDLIWADGTEAALRRYLGS